VNADGTVVVGYGYDTSGQTQAFRWTAASGMVGLGFLPRYNQSYALEVNADALATKTYSLKPSDWRSKCAMSPSPTVRCPDFLHNPVRSIHHGQYFQDARAIDGHRSVFGPIHISVPAPGQVAVENKPDQLRVLVEQWRAGVSSYRLVGCRNV
jgi:probable HAF family extracellular repeat protein